MRFVKVELGGRERTVRFGLRVIGKMVRHYNNDPGELMMALGKNQFESVPLLFFYGLEYEEEKNGRIPDFTLFDVTEWIEEKGVNNEYIDKALQAFFRTLYDNVPAIKALIDAKDAQKEAEGSPGFKKKLIGTEI